MKYSKTEESRSLKNENDTGQLIFFIMQLYVIVGSVETLTNDSAGTQVCYTICSLNTPCDTSRKTTKIVKCQLL